MIVQTLKNTKNTLDFVEVMCYNNNGDKEMYNDVLIGNIYFMEFSGDMTEQNGWRPGVVIQNNIGNKYSPNIIAVPLTSSLKKLNMPTHVVLRKEDTGLYTDSVVLCENPQILARKKIGAFISSLPKYYMKQIAIACTVSMPLISFLDKESLIVVWNDAKCLTCAL